MRHTAIDFFISKNLSLEGVVTTPESPGAHEQQVANRVTKFLVQTLRG